MSEERLAQFMAAALPVLLQDMLEEESIGKVGWLNEDGETISFEEHLAQWALHIAIEANEKLHSGFNELRPSAERKLFRKLRILLPSLMVTPNAARALCPFHEEKTPSFHINIHGNSYKCFGCEKVGTVGSLLVELEKKAVAGKN